MTIRLDAPSRRGLMLGAAAAAVTAGLPGAASAKAPMLHSQSPYFYRFTLGDAEATMVSDGTLPLGDPHSNFLGLTGRDGRAAQQQLPAAVERGAGAEHPDPQHRQQAGAVRYRHGLAQAVRADHRQAAYHDAPGRHRPEGHRRRGDEPRPCRPLRRLRRRRRHAAFPQRPVLHLAGRFRLLDRSGQGAGLVQRLPRHGAQETCCRSATASSSSRTARNSCPASRRSRRPATASATRCS